MKQKITYAFFGTGALAESVLSALVHAGYMPSLVVTKPDSRSGRHMHLSSPHIKTWAEMKGVEVFQPETLQDLNTDSSTLSKGSAGHALFSKKFDVFIVASYGKIIPESILSLATHGALNVHPSLLPKYRGPSPIESVLLDGHMTTGVTIIKLDKQMDHGPILAQTAHTISLYANVGTLEVTCGQIGGELLVSVLPHYLEGTLIPQEQDHTQATVCKKITKELGLVLLGDDIDAVRRKFRALTPWPTLYFFVSHDGKNMRVKINEIKLVEEKDSRKIEDYIVSVTPEGKKQMDWESFVRGYMNSL